MRTRTLLASILALILAALLGAGLQPSVARAQGDAGLDPVDQDSGRKLRHPGTQLTVPNSKRKSPDPAVDGAPGRRSFEARPKWEYHWFDHPVPSYQYFRQPQAYTWRYDSYPGIRPYLDPHNTYSFYYYYYYNTPPHDYYPPGYYWRYGPRSWYGW
jgi:hypothetical protein